MDKELYDRLSELNKREFWDYVERSGYNQHSVGTTGAPHMTYDRYNSLPLATQQSWWVRFEGHFGTVFQPDESVPRPEFFDGLGVFLFPEEGEEEMVFEVEEEVGDRVVDDGKFEVVRGFKDVAGLAPQTGYYGQGGPEAKGYFNIDDPTFGIRGETKPGGGTYEKFWNDFPLSLVPPREERGPMTCEQECRDKISMRKKKCTVLRKRVAAMLKEMGCPSKVTPYANKRRK